MGERLDGRQVGLRWLVLRYARPLGFSAGKCEVVILMGEVSAEGVACEDVTRFGIGVVKGKRTWEARHGGGHAMRHGIRQGR